MLRPFKNSTKWNLFLSLDYWLGHLLLHHLQTCSGKFKIIKIFFSLGLKASRILHLTAPFLPDGVFDFKNRASSYLDTTIFTITEQILIAALQLHADLSVYFRNGHNRWILYPEGSVYSSGLSLRECSFWLGSKKVRFYGGRLRSEFKGIEQWLN